MARLSTHAVAAGLAFGVVAAQSMPAPRDERVAVDAAWLDEAVPSSDFEHDLAMGALHFIELTGHGPITPGLGAIRRYMCYSQHAGTKVLDVGYCLITSEADLSIRERAFTYGEAYNTILVSYLDRAGLSDCSSTVDWDAAWAAVNKWAGSVGRGNRGTTKMGRTELRVYLNDFSTAGRAARDVCSLLRKHGLDRPYMVETSPREFINTEREDEQVYRLKCTPSHEP